MTKTRGPGHEMSTEAQMAEGPERESVESTVDDMWSGSWPRSRKSEAVSAWRTSAQAGL